MENSEENIHADIGGKELKDKKTFVLEDIRSDQKK